jgi:hypothetical protein
MSEVAGKRFLRYILFPFKDKQIGILPFDSTSFTLLFFSILLSNITNSFLKGMRQLQQTVEKLAIRVSVARADIETEKCSLLQVCCENSVFAFLDCPFLFLLFESTRLK